MRYRHIACIKKHPWRTNSAEVNPQVRMYPNHTERYKYFLGSFANAAFSDHHNIPIRLSTPSN